MSRNNKSIEQLVNELKGLPKPTERELKGYILKCVGYLIIQSLLIALMLFFGKIIDSDEITIWGFIRTHITSINNFQSFLGSAIILLSTVACIFIVVVAIVRLRDPNALVIKNEEKQSVYYKINELAVDMIMNSCMFAVGLCICIISRSPIYELPADFGIMMIEVSIIFFSSVFSSIYISRLKLTKRKRLVMQIDYLTGNHKPKNNNVNQTERRTDNLDALLEYKKLLDNGTITKEEFEKKKDQLLK